MAEMNMSDRLIANRPAPETPARFSAGAAAPPAEDRGVQDLEQGTAGTNTNTTTAAVAAGVQTWRFCISNKGWKCWKWHEKEGPIFTVCEVPDVVIRACGWQRNPFAIYDLENTFLWIACILSFAFSMIWLSDILKFECAIVYETFYPTGWSKCVFEAFSSVMFFKISWDLAYLLPRYDPRPEGSQQELDKSKARKEEAHDRYVALLRNTAEDGKLKDQGNFKDYVKEIQHSRETIYDLHEKVKMENANPELQSNIKICCELSDAILAKADEQLSVTEEIQNDPSSHENNPSRVPNWRWIGCCSTPAWAHGSPHRSYHLVHCSACPRCIKSIWNIWCFFFQCFRMCLVHFLQRCRHRSEEEEEEVQQQQQQQQQQRQDDGPCNADRYWPPKQWYFLGFWVEIHSALHERLLQSLITTFIFSIFNVLIFYEEVHVWQDPRYATNKWRKKTLWELSIDLIQTGCCLFVNVLYLACLIVCLCRIHLLEENMKRWADLQANERSIEKTNKDIEKHLHRSEIFQQVSNFMDVRTTEGKDFKAAKEGLKQIEILRGLDVRHQGNIKLLSEQFSGLRETLEKMNETLQKRDE